VPDLHAHAAVLDALKGGQMELTTRQWEILRAVTEMQARDAEHGDFDRALTEFDLVKEQPTAHELRVIADVIATDHPWPKN